MEVTTTQADIVVIVFGKTYGIKGELASLGFRWSQENKAWYHLGLLDEGHCEFLAWLVNDPPWPGISLRYCELDRPLS